MRKNWRKAPVCSGALREGGGGGAFPFFSEIWVRDCLSTFFEIHNP